MIPVPTIKQSLAAIIGERYPWLLHVVTVAGSKGRGLALRTASGLLHLAGGPDDPAVVRVGDAGTGGSLTASLAVLTYTSPDGAITTFSFAVSGGAVIITQAGVPGDGAIATKATAGSAKVTCA